MVTPEEWILYPVHKEVKTVLKKQLLQVAFLYGQLSSMILLLTIGILGPNTPKIKEVIDNWGFDTHVFQWGSIGLAVIQGAYLIVRLVKLQGKK